MIRRMLFLTLLALAALALAACGGKEAEQTQATQQTQEAPAPAAEPAAEAPAEAVATHDCAGGCGMTAVPEDQLTEIDGKWYCAGCAKKAEEAHEGHGHG